MSPTARCNQWYLTAARCFKGNSASKASTLISTVASLISCWIACGYLNKTSSNATKNLPKALQRLHHQTGFLLPLLAVNCVIFLQQGVISWRFCPHAGRKAVVVKPRLRRRIYTLSALDDTCEPRRLDATKTNDLTGCAVTARLHHIARRIRITEQPSDWSSV